mgnify:CR=1 FL=1
MFIAKKEMNMFLVILVVVSSLISICWRGYVASMLWDWFIVPLGVTKISIEHSIGILCLIDVFLSSRGLEKNTGEFAVSKYIEQLVFSILLPSAALIIGWIVK